IVATINDVKAEDDPAGKIKLEEWGVMCHHTPGGWRDYPLDKMKHSLKEGALECTNTTGLFQYAGVVYTRVLEGNYTISCEVRNATHDVGLRSAGAHPHFWAPSGAPLAGNEWRKVVLTKKNGTVTISVDGNNVPVNLTGIGSLDKAVFYVAVNSNDTA